MNALAPIAPKVDPLTRAGWPDPVAPVRDPQHYRGRGGRLTWKTAPVRARFEAHGGAYPGRHGVYVLHSDVELEATT